MGKPSRSGIRCLLEKLDGRPPGASSAAQACQGSTLEAEVSRGCATGRSQGANSPEHYVRPCFYRLNTSEATQTTSTSILALGQMGSMEEGSSHHHRRVSAVLDVVPASGTDRCSGSSGGKTNDPEAHRLRGKVAAYPARRHYR